MGVLLEPGGPGESRGGGEGGGSGGGVNVRVLNQIGLPVVVHVSEWIWFRKFYGRVMGRGGGVGDGDGDGDGEGAVKDKDRDRDRDMDRDRRGRGRCGVCEERGLMALEKGNTHDAAACVAGRVVGAVDGATGRDAEMLR